MYICCTVEINSTTTTTTTTTDAPREDLMYYVAPSNGIFFCTVAHCTGHIFKFVSLEAIVKSKMAAFELFFNIFNKNQY